MKYETDGERQVHRKDIRRAGHHLPDWKTSELSTSGELYTTTWKEADISQERIDSPDSKLILEKPESFVYMKLEIKT